jgi:hypothetical protein
VGKIESNKLARSCPEPDDINGFLGVKEMKGVYAYFFHSFIVNRA